MTKRHDPVKRQFLEDNVNRLLAVFQSSEERWITRRQLQRTSGLSTGTLRDAINHLTHTGRLMDRSNGLRQYAIKTEGAVAEPKYWADWRTSVITGYEEKLRKAATLAMLSRR